MHPPATKAMKVTGQNIDFRWVRSSESSDDGDRLWRLNAYVDGEPAGFCDGWDFIDREPYGVVRVWGEGHLALRLMTLHDQPIAGVEDDYVFGEEG
jgi:hypothetical protein